ncbi:MAG: hypothetical protein QME47_08285 [Candidatus Thermoplasmatota archaeon]|nr:hypothetical protein [Candidatus Thermoplasmatota archaeon]
MRSIEKPDERKLTTWIIAYAKNMEPEELVEKICAKHPMNEEERAVLILTIRQMIDSRALFRDADGKLSLDMWGV